MSEPETILAHAARLLGRRGPLAGKRVLVTAGPTREPIDPVRVVTNRSSGKMGYRLAEAAWERGAEVMLISGPSALVCSGRCHAADDRDHALSWRQAVRDALPAADVLIMAAAPADYRPRTSDEAKRPRAEGGLAIAMEPTQRHSDRDARPAAKGARHRGLRPRNRRRRRKGAEKLRRKELDLIVVNDALEPDAAFEVDTNRVMILDQTGGRKDVPLGSKREVAEAILDSVEARLGR